MAVIGFLGSFCLYTMRVNMSLAIVCMVKDNTTTNYNTSVNVKCGTDELHVGQNTTIETVSSIIIPCFRILKSYWRISVFQY